MNKSGLWVIKELTTFYILDPSQNTKQTDISPVGDRKPTHIDTRDINSALLFAWQGFF